ncbi:hypothetical protein Pcinc_040271 [Petrolisthes cinctipes]|uniref:Uncharacterized protein n=1 Tax=Petrolisthes cinctipes TaxID=88211 RepID=A0AAE1BML3_PETCI|nr:hypothetical protein Pcinc_040271 [Petrolisthes cinctipes]
MMRPKTSALPSTKQLQCHRENRCSAIEKAATVPSRTPLQCHPENRCSAIEKAATVPSRKKGIVQFFADRSFDVVSEVKDDHQLNTTWLN